MIKKILVPLDGTPAAEAVLPQVTQKSHAEGAEVELVTVLTPVAIWDAAASMIKWDAEEAAAQKYIDGKRQELANRGISAHFSVPAGKLHTRSSRRPRTTTWTSSPSPLTDGLGSPGGCWVASPKSFYTPPRRYSWSARG
jgi:hypothetical protein